jgi:hypothetical protein
MQNQQDNLLVSLYDFYPANPTYPLTYISARSTSTAGIISNLAIDRLQDRPSCARVQATVTVPIEVLYTDANGVEGIAKSQITLNEDVILFRTDKNDTFENYYSYVSKNSSIEKFGKRDNLKVPELNVDKLISYNELTGKKIIGADYVISQALQTIKFKLDRKGGSLKSEAAITIMKTSLMPEEEKIRNFNFDKKFVLFLKEQSKDKPYYAMKVDTTEFLVKE